MKRALKAQMSISELLQAPGLSEKLEEIMEAAAAAAAPAAPPAGSTAASAADESPADVDSRTAGEVGAAHPIALQVNLGSKEGSEETTTKFKNLEPDAKLKLEDMEKEAMRLVDIGCQFLVDRPGAAELASDMRKTERSKTTGSPIDG